MLKLLVLLGCFNFHFLYLDLHHCIFLIDFVKLFFQVVVLLHDFFEFDRILRASKTFLRYVYYLLVTLFLTGLLFTLVKYTFLLERFCAANPLHRAVTLHYSSIPDLVLPDFFHGLTKGPLACVTSQNGFIVSSSDLNNGRFVSKITLTGRLS